MNDHTEGDRVEFDVLDPLGGTLHGEVINIHRSPGKLKIILGYIVLTDDGGNYFVPPQNLYPEQDTP